MVENGVPEYQIQNNKTRNSRSRTPNLERQNLEHYIQTPIYGAILSAEIAKLGTLTHEITNLGEYL